MVAATKALEAGVVSKGSEGRRVEQAAVAGVARQALLQVRERPLRVVLAGQQGGEEQVGDGEIGGRGERREVVDPGPSTVAGELAQSAA